MTSIAPVVFTKSAALKVYQLMQEEGNPNLNLRVFVTGGGCSGLQYGFTFDDKVNADDTIISEIIEANFNSNDNSSDPTAVNLLIDSMSLQYLKRAEIDYKEDIEGSRFVIRNPNAKTTCGCGSSFSD